MYLLIQGQQQLQAPPQAGQLVTYNGSTYLLQPSTVDLINGVRPSSPGVPQPSEPTTPGTNPIAIAAATNGLIPASGATISQQFGNSGSANEGQDQVPPLPGIFLNFYF